uniref:Uncharacterized protein n=1 Tax=Trypanosoma congolense (strain IL3000) TaxID=1068625 RepID=G0UUW1_TRYCI|nr:hypothetical protein, unlikely [Trypanosoma congolense IL3000]
MPYNTCRNSPGKKSWGSAPPQNNTNNSIGLLPPPPCLPSVMSFFFPCYSLIFPSLLPPTHKRWQSQPWRIPPTITFLTRQRNPLSFDVDATHIDPRHNEMFP